MIGMLFFMLVTIAAAIWNISIHLGRIVDRLDKLIEQRKP